MIDIAVLGYLISIGAVVALIPGLRNVRFVAFVASMIAAFIAAGALPQDIRLLVRIVPPAIVGLAIVVAESVGLGSLTAAERDTERDLRRAEPLAAAGDPASVRAAAETIDGILSSKRVIDDEWRAGLRMQRRAWLLRIGSSAVPASSATPVTSFQAAAIRWLNDLRLRRTIGYRRTSGAFEEAIAIRAYLDDIRSSLPSGPIGPDPTPRGDWSEKAGDAIEELRRVPLRHPNAEAVRESLVRLLASEIEMRATAPTASDQVAYDQLVAELDERWRRLDAPFWDGQTPRAS